MDTLVSSEALITIHAPKEASEMAEGALSSAIMQVPARAIIAAAIVCGGILCPASAAIIGVQTAVS